MLYKKYHRDYVRQFKKGTRLATFKMKVDKIEIRNILLHFRNMYRHFCRT